MACFLPPDAILFEFGPFPRNSTRVTYRRTDRRTDKPSYRDATAHLKTKTFKGEDVFGHPFRIKAEIRPFGKGEVAPSGLVGGRRFHVAIQIGEDARRLKRGGGGEMTW